MAVHGLGGDAINTKTHPKSKKFWLKDFLPQQIPDARIMTFGYNADAAKGIDSAFHRGETPRGLTRFAPGDTLGSIEQAPFYGIELHPTSLASAGVLADQRGRVLHVRGMPIPGLYAIGNAAARTETGSGYQTGFSLASAMTFSLLAVRHMKAQ